MAREVDLKTFAAAWAAGALVLDVREPAEYRAGHVPGARLTPLSAPATLADPALRLPTDRPVYVICASGNRSRWAADQLTALGVDARSVAEGTKGWISAGRRVATGLTPGLA
ncbi:rhodanese-like domain-containing protein [Streptomyces sp. TRM49041]|uniref:rhodanese-like domain-containing protein n=1 Tax=Streptomyces sp. TRM49041 TaxID=2603216 RepID=UPI0011EE7D50|nr:rhodanese-like domain-containing protein [Streptomyces sp. TRM49041]